MTVQRRFENVKKIVILEGPAGSGKSTLMQNLQDRSHMVPMETHKETLGLLLDRPRELSIDSGPRNSQLKDYVTALCAAEYPHNHVPVVIDRYALSQWVYRQIRSIEDLRNGHVFSNPGWTQQEAYMAHKTFENGLNQLLFAQRDLRIRKGFYAPGNIVLEVFNFVLLPDLDLLAENRSQAGRKFPYDAAQELSLYTDIAGEIDNAQLYNLGDDIRVKTTTLKYSNYYELNQLTDIVEDIVRAGLKPEVIGRYKWLDTSSL